MIFGIGTDIVSYSRIHALHERYGSRFAQRILSPVEFLEYGAHADPARLLMKRFAAKEALSKASGSGMRYPVTLQRISVAHDVLGKPTLVFDEELNAHFGRLGVSRHHLSISDERDVAVAFVVLEGER